MAGSDDDEEDKVIHVGPAHQAEVPACGPMADDAVPSEREQQLFGAPLPESESVQVQRRAWGVAELCALGVEQQRQPKESFLSIAKSAGVAAAAPALVQCYYHLWKQHQPQNHLRAME